MGKEFTTQFRAAALRSTPRAREQVMILLGSVQHKGAKGLSFKFLGRQNNVQRERRVLRTHGRLRCEEVEKAE